MKTPVHDRKVADDATIAVLRVSGRILTARIGQVIYRQGDRSTTVYLIESGRVRFSIDAGAGHELTVGSAFPGSIFGELGSIHSGPRESTAVAVRPSRLIAIPSGAFRDLLEDHPTMRAFVLETLGNQLRSARRQLAASCWQTTVSRVAGQLITLTDAEDSDSTDRLRITQSELAEWVGSTREATARALAILRRSGWVATGRGWIIVLDREALAGLEAV